MILTLYGPETTDFSGSGLGALEDVRNDEVREVLNGQFELTLQYPVAGRLFFELQRDAYITARPNALMGPQPFRIYRIQKALNGWVTVYARHISYRLRTIVCRYISGSNAAESVASLKTNAVGECPFEFFTDIDSTLTTRTWYPMTIWKLMGTDEYMLQGTYGGDWELDGYNVRLLRERGTYRGMQIFYGVNMRDVQRDAEYADRFNGIYAYRLDDYGIAIEEAMVMCSDYVEGMERRLEPRDYTGKYPDKTAAYLAETDLLLEGISAARPEEQSVKVDFERLSRTEEYRDMQIPDAIGMGDKVDIFHEALGINARWRVTEIRYQPSTGKYKSIVLGNPPKSVVQTILRR